MDTHNGLRMKDFTELEEEFFSVAEGDVSMFEARLVEVKPMGTGLRDGGAFALLWQGPEAPALTQATYRVSHATTGALDVFLVPVARNDDGFCYEAVFT